jgi:ATP-binding cassette subfamily F protein uup
VASKPPSPAPPAAKPAAPASPAKAKLSYKDARELEQLPARIEALESELARRSEAMNEPAFYQRDAAAIADDNAALSRLQAELDAAYARWAELEG